MAWNDLGLIFKVSNLLPWAVSHCYVPTALQLHDRIRIFAAFLDQNKYGRLGYVDVCSQDPNKIIDYSRSPLMDDAKRGAFDCDGVTPLSVIKLNDRIILYYAGWKKV